MRLPAMPTPTLFTAEELTRLDPQMRTVAPIVALASIVDLGNHLVESYDGMTETERSAAVILSDRWPTPPHETTELPEAILAHMPADYNDPPQGKELIRRRAALCRERLEYLRDWQRFRTPGVLEAELQRLVETGTLEEEDRQNAVAHLEGGETLANLVSFRDAMCQMEKMLNRERRRVNTM